MANEFIPELRLDSLKSGVPALTPPKADVHMEACVWCLLECDHSNGVMLHVEMLEQGCRYYISWPDERIDVDALFRAYNKDDGPEQGAEAIAFLLIREKTDYTAIRRSITTTGFDYWLDYKSSSSGQIFSKGIARLEVSGILRQTSTNKVEYRAQKKIQQTKQSDHTDFPAYIIIVEFSQPMSKVIIRNAKS